MKKFYWVFCVFVVSFLFACSGGQFASFEPVPEDGGLDGASGTGGSSGSSGHAGKGGSSTGGQAGSGGQVLPDAGDSGLGGSSGSGGSSGKGGAAGNGGAGQGGTGGTSQGGAAGADAGCIPGDSIPCDCNGKPVGAMVCQDNFVFGPCQCPPPPDAGPDAEAGLPPDAGAQEICQLIGVQGHITFLVMAGEIPLPKKLGAHGKTDPTGNPVLWGESLTDKLFGKPVPHPGTPFLQMVWAFESGESFSLWQSRVGNSADKVVFCADKQPIGGLLDSSNGFQATNPVGKCEPATNSWGQQVINCMPNQ